MRSLCFSVEIGDRNADSQMKMVFEVLISIEIKAVSIHLTKFNDEQYKRILKEILNDFCELLGHKVNSRKTTIYFSRGVEESLANRLSTLLSFREVDDLGRYLVILLFHKRVTNSTLHFVIDKVCAKLQSWDAHQLYFAGRVTLVQSVLLAIPSYFMQSMMITRQICDEIECLVKRFIWGTTDGKKKMSLVSWDFICQPKWCGGLGMDSYGIRTLLSYLNFVINWFQMLKLSKFVFSSLSMG
ncbi:hypothetical protein PVK06_029042 [Gossypium arboreum]|uniref:Reverse transcriptase n=1 Tax=Gossypium arboreum TaxID=29729 RepID=A0ABR0P5K0_GOSAR|nr:hypothetical protein PVK06_029042 [Gossypium arboreum]